MVFFPHWPRRVQNYRGPSGIPRTTEAVTKRPKRSVLPYFSCGNYQSRPADEATDWKAHRFPLAAWKSFDPWDQAYHLPVLRFFPQPPWPLLLPICQHSFRRLVVLIFCLFVHRTSSLFFINFIHDHLQVVMKIIHHRNDLAVFHTGRVPTRQRVPTTWPFRR